MGLAVTVALLLAGLAVTAYRLRPHPAAAPAVPQDVAAFLERLAAVLRIRHPHVRMCGLIPGRFAAVLSIAGQEVPVPLDPLFRRFTTFPGRFAGDVAALLEQVEANGLEHTEDHPLGDVATSILPQIRTKEWLRQHAAVFGPSSLVHRELTDELVVCYVIDGPACMTFVCQEHLCSWGLAEADLFHLSRRNLRQAAGSALPVPGPQDEGLLLRSGDGFDAARVLLLDEERTEGLLVALPERDLLWVGRERRDGLARLMALTEEQSRRASHPLSPTVYRVARGKLVPVTDGVTDGDSAARSASSPAP
jgi:uncharacterized protein YtpQ (UPF0354 family)